MKMNWFQFAQFCLLAAQQVIQLVIQAEQVLGAGKGEQKKPLVVGTIAAAAKKAGADSNQASEINGLASELVDTNVALLNETGVFKHGTASNAE